MRHLGLPGAPGAHHHLPLRCRWLRPKQLSPRFLCGHRKPQRHLASAFYLLQVTNRPIGAPLNCAQPGDDLRAQTVAYAPRQPRGRLAVLFTFWFYLHTARSEATGSRTTSKATVPGLSPLPTMKLFLAMNRAA